MNITDNLKFLSQNIFKLRKDNGLTQEELAEKLNISFQAVSKWENGQTAPDIMLLPLLSQIFKVSIDALFREKPESAFEFIPEVNWEDDDKIRGIVYKGKKILEDHEDLSKFTFTIIGDALDVSANCNVKCTNVKGNINAGNNVDCCDIEGNINAGNNIDCNNINGTAIAGNNIDCDIINGNVIAGNIINS